jgi:hypothetical protein
MKIAVVAAAILLLSSQALAQAPGSAVAAPVRPPGGTADNGSLATPTGHQLNFNVTSYTYKEPSETTISIHGPKVGGEYTGTFSLNKRRHWFAQANVRAVAGHATYDGWCSPFLIRPNSASPNGYELDLGDPSPCSETGDSDWYFETRGLAGKDVIRSTWAFSPYAGLGVRHLSNGTTGTPGFRTDNYLYLPFGITARTRVRTHGALSLNLEYDRLIHGWQTTRNSALGGGEVPATPTAPAFTIEGITDVSFDQHGGWALRASGTYQATRRWSVEPYYIYWNVGASPVSYETATFTVNNVTAHEQMGFYEPWNVTHEYGVKLGFHF